MSNVAFTTAVNCLFSIARMSTHDRNRHVPIEWAIARAKKLGMTKAAFARAVGVLSQDVNNWTKRGLPADRYEKVADVLRCTIDELVGRALPLRDSDNAWPFQAIAEERFRLLTRSEKLHVEAALEEEIDRLEQARREKNRQRKAAGVARP